MGANSDLLLKASGGPEAILKIHIGQEARNDLIHIRSGSISMMHSGNNRPMQNYSSNVLIARDNSLMRNLSKA